MGMAKWLTSAPGTAFTYEYEIHQKEFLLESVAENGDELPFNKNML